MNKLLCKPCFAFEALASLVFCNYCRKDIPEVAEWVKNTYKGITIGPSNRFFNILINHHSLAEIESFNIDRLIQIYPQYIHEDAYTNQFADAITSGLHLLKESHFEKIWSNTLLSIVEKQCENFLSACNSEKVSNILMDIEKVHGKPITDDIIIYMTFFTSPVSFLLTPCCYLTNGSINEVFNTNNTSCVICTRALSYVCKFQIH